MSDLGFNLGELGGLLRGEEVKSDSDIIQGTVVSTQSPTYTITLQGDTTTIPGVRSLVPLTANDVIWVLKKGNFLLALSHQDTGWHNVGAAGEPVFQSSWVNFGGIYVPARFRKVGGIVTVEGMVKSGIVPNAIFTLPAGYRPSIRLYFGGVVQSAFARLDVLATGEIAFQTGASTPSDAGFLFSFPADA